MHESWPLKLLPASRQTLYWTQTTPREKRITVHFFSPQHTETQTHTHNFKCSVLQMFFFFIPRADELIWFFILGFVAPEGEHHFYFSPGGRRAPSSFSAWDWDLTAASSFLWAFLKTFRVFFFLCLFFRFFYIYIFIVVVVVLDFLLEQQVRVRSVVFFSSEWLDDGYFTRNCAPDGAPSAGPELPKNRLPPGR